MSLPGFTAEAALRRERTRYRAAATSQAPAGAGLVTPQTWIECRSGWSGDTYYLCCVNYYTRRFICRAQRQAV